MSRKDAGTYQCQAESSMGLSIPSSQNLDVQRKVNKTSHFSFKFTPFQIIPHWLLSPSNVEIKARQQLTLNYYSESYPRADYTWLQQLPSEEVVLHGYEPSLDYWNSTFRRGCL